MAEKAGLTKDQKLLAEVKAENEVLLNRCDIAEKRVKALVDFAKSTLETNADLLNQIDGASKSNRKLHNMGAQNLGQLIKVLEDEAK